MCVIITLSFAYFATNVSECVDWSAEYISCIVWIVGDKMAPWSSPIKIAEKLEISHLDLTARQCSFK